ncbi:hypothetical protein [Brevundimonas sp.]|uniref:hypothetical protein n=1 Tax=Brevundimonas sp. TaxID=1871086 RepID=UPI002C308FE6|nr:hypothetical protein [Brevundimonas sp.]HWQ88154.1 hypothetical protein [Brevundimonas sp.]
MDALKALKRFGKPARLQIRFRSAPEARLIWTFSVGKPTWELLLEGNDGEVLSLLSRDRNFEEARRRLVLDGWAIEAAEDAAVTIPWVRQEVSTA